MPPTSIEQLAREAEAGIHWNTRYPLKVYVFSASLVFGPLPDIPDRWLNSVNALRDRALAYEKAGKNDVAYILMARAAT